MKRKLAAALVGVGFVALGAVACVVLGLNMETSTIMGLIFGGVGGLLAVSIWEGP